MRPVSPWIKAALEYGPLLVFFVVYQRMRDATVTLGGTEYSGFILATLVFVPLSVLATLALWRLTGRVSAMQLVSLALIVVFGGLSVWLNDPRFFKMKPTLIYLVFALVLGAGLALRRNWLALVMGEALPMTPAGWRILTARLAALFLGLALLNEAVWRLASEAAWVKFKIFGVTGILLLFFLAQGGLMRRHAAPQAVPPTGDDRP